MFGNVSFSFDKLGVGLPPANLFFLVQAPCAYAEASWGRFAGDGPAPGGGLWRGGPE